MGQRPRRLRPVWSIDPESREWERQILVQAPRCHGRPFSQPAASAPALTLAFILDVVVGIIVADPRFFHPV